MTRFAVATIALALAAAVGCDGGRGHEPNTWRVVGALGRQPGQFSKPRAVCVTKEGQAVVIDRTGRVQILDARTGEFIRQWRLLAWENGTPTGASPDPLGNTVWIADTHYHRILHYDLEGNLLLAFGSEGEQPGSMVFPTDVCPSPDGATLWVTDYGRRNRVIQFTRTGEFLREWGEEMWENAEVDRPQAISVSPDGQHLYVVDAGNCRINVYTPEGVLVRHISGPGIEEGRLKYPLDLAVAADGSLYIIEYESSRISRFSAEGEFLGSLGGPGRGPGQFFTPWGGALSPDGALIIADTGNNRLQWLDRPAEAMAAGREIAATAGRR